MAGRSIKCPNCDGPVKIPVPDADIVIQSIEELPDETDASASPPGLLPLEDDVPPPSFPGGGETPLQVGEAHSRSPAPPFESDEPPPGGVRGDIPDFMKKKAEEEGLKPGDFFPQLNRVFYYPVRNLTGIFFLLFMGPLTYVAGMLGFTFFGLLLNLVVWGYISTYLWDVMYDAAMKDRGPLMPMLSEMGELTESCLRFWWSFAVAYAPCIFIFIYFVSRAFSADFGEDTSLVEGGVLFVLFLVAGLVGSFYLPMSQMLAGFSGGFFMSLNFLFAFRSIARILPHYAVAVLYFAGTFIGGTLLEGYVLGLLVSVDISFLILAGVIFRFIELYMLVMQSRVLGLLYACNKERLGWFR